MFCALLIWFCQCGGGSTWKPLWPVRSIGHFFQTEIWQLWEGFGGCCRVKRLKQFLLQEEPSPTEHVLLVWDTFLVTLVVFPFSATPWACPLSFVLSLGPFLDVPCPPNDAGLLLSVWIILYFDYLWTSQVTSHSSLPMLLVDEFQSQVNPSF